MTAHQTTIVVGNTWLDPTTGESGELIYDRPARSEGFKPGVPGRKPAALGHRPLLPWQQPASHTFARLERAPTRRCETPGCRRESRPGRSMCNRCRQLVQLYGSATIKAQFHFRKWCAVPTTRAYQLIKHVQQLPRSHPARSAVDHAVQLLGLRIDSASRYASQPWRAWMKPDEQIRRRLGQYRRHGVSAEQLLAHIAGWLWARNTFPQLADDDAYWRYQMGRYLLGYIGLPHAECAGRAERVGSVAARTFAKQLLDTVGTVAAYLAEPAEFARLYDVELPPKVLEAPSQYAIEKATRKPIHRPLQQDD